MARAKHTVRADARRRYRAATRSVDPEGSGEAAPVASQSSNHRPAQAATPAPTRPSFTAAFRDAYHPAHVREDLAALPGLLRTRGFLAAVGLIILGAVAWYLPENPVSTLAFQYLTYPPALVPIFLVGALAPRASYLLGLVVGGVDALVFSLVLLSRGIELTGITAEQLLPQLVSLVFVSLSMGLLFAAAAAWYRRFLAFTNRGRARAQSRSNARSSARPKR